MFRKIKKWYFKIYHLFKLISVFILVFGLCNRVYAEEYKSCFDDYLVGEVTFTKQDANWTFINELIPIEKDTTYYLKFFPAENYTCSNNGSGNTCFGTSVYYFGKDKEYMLNSSILNVSFDKEKQILTFKTKNINNIKYLKLFIFTNNTNYQVLQGKKMIISSNIENVESCTEEEPEPPTQDSVYSSFLTLYTDKISYLANGFTTNPYLLAMIGIIFSFVVLELFLKILHLKGGKYR